MTFKLKQNTMYRKEKNMFFTWPWFANSAKFELLIMYLKCIWRDNNPYASYWKDILRTDFTGITVNTKPLIKLKVGF